MFAQLRDGAETQSGVFVYDNRDSTLASKHTPPMDILITYETDFREGYKFPPVTFINLSNFECLSGVLFKRGGGCNFRHIDGLDTTVYSTSVSRFQEQNKDLGRRALRPGFQFTKLNISQGGTVTFVDKPFTELKKGRTAMLYWISSHALSLAVITQAVFKLVSGAENILRAPGKTVRPTPSFGSSGIQPRFQLIFPRGLSFYVREIKTCKISRGSPQL